MVLEPSYLLIIWNWELILAFGYQLALVRLTSSSDLIALAVTQKRRPDVAILGHPHGFTSKRDSQSN